MTDKIPFDLGINGTCTKCGKRLCYCEERQSDGSWKDGTAFFQKPPHFHNWKYNEMRWVEYTGAESEMRVFRFCTRCLFYEDVILHEDENRPMTDGEKELAKGLDDFFEKPDKPIYPDIGM